MNFDGRDLATLGKLIVQQPVIGKVRRTGSSAMDVVYVASGAYDAFIDIGDILTGRVFPGLVKHSIRSRRYSE